ncbi:MAG: hypothetical protein JEY94_00040 [Melioribacteraceae bacterium]|nr:hypothetical protein [Melioribacteraceae bacterium]
MKRGFKRIVISLCLFFFAQSIFAQNPLKGLIITEVLLSEKNPSNSWIEIYNPTDDILTLEKLRLSTIRTVNMLDQEYRINPGESVLVCFNDEQFRKTYSFKNIQTIECELFKYLSDEGFIAITTKDNRETGGDIVYFKKEKTGLEKNVENTVVFSKEKSFKRQIVQTKGQIKLDQFQEAIPTPGTQF